MTEIKLDIEQTRLCADRIKDMSVLVKKDIKYIAHDEWKTNTLCLITFIFCLSPCIFIVWIVQGVEWATYALIVSGIMTCGISTWGYMVTGLCTDFMYNEEVDLTDYSNYEKIIFVTEEPITTEIMHVPETVDIERQEHIHQQLPFKNKEHDPGFYVEYKHTNVIRHKTPAHSCEVRLGGIKETEFYVLKKDVRKIYEMINDCKNSDYSYEFSDDDSHSISH